MNRKIKSVLEKQISVSSAQLYFYSRCCPGLIHSFICSFCSGPTVGNEETEKANKITVSLGKEFMQWPPVITILEL